ncbi:hypothetical protein SAMN02745857_00792 [Andreprevotia lacus DSM 23236]|jgi:hypothetical protein|uniref:Uncharacterized protein n=1 Tax=Andreprevotia lacus DSM 23236 TaxID=1121001 RepID=A0A1W1X7G7_9NEIS|nr:hypothetical protein [Andreprevotia lacus]SMC19777.1 hypothetical protein SAMN02745857_00792 [Andreprevotia lacus DSM 23236]
MVILSGTGSWRARLALPLTQRAATAPQHFIDYFSYANALTGNPRQLRPVALPTDFLADVAQAITELPATLQQRLASKLLGIYFVAGLGSTGLTDVLLDESGNIIGCFVLLDAEVLMQRTANQWASWKINIPFRPGNANLALRIADGADNTRKTAIQHILLHEFAHVLSTGEAILPDWWRSSAELGNTADYAFLQLAWTISADKRIVPTLANTLPLLDKVDYAGDRPLAATDVQPVYQALAQSAFPTLYAATSVYDDFAESFAVYVHTELLGRPFETTLSDGTRTVLQFNATDWLQRQPARRAFLRQYLTAN